MNKKKQPPQPDPDNEDQENPDAEEQGEIESWDEELRDWATEENTGGRRIVFTAYRLDPTGKEKARFAYRWNEMIPNPHELGLQCGGGKYRVILTIEGKKDERKISNRIIWIDATYDDVRAELKAQREAQAATRGPVPGSDLTTALTIIEKMNAAYAPLLAGRPAPGGELATLPGMQASLGAFLKDVFKSQIDVYRDAQQGILATRGAPGAPAAAGAEKELTQRDMIELGIQFVEAAGLKDWMGKVFARMGEAKNAGT